jgi:hypothetical protein
MNLVVTVMSVINLDISATVGICFSPESYFPYLWCDVVDISHKAVMIRTEES